MINMACVTPSSTDIHRKFQQLEDFAEMNNSQLLKVANEVFENRDQKAKGLTVSLLIAAMGNRAQNYKLRRPHKRKKPKRDLHCAETNAPSAKRPAIGKTSALIVRKHLKSQKNFSQKEDTNLSQWTGPRDNQTRSGSPPLDTKEGVHGSSVIRGQHEAGYAIVTDDEVSE